MGNKITLLPGLGKTDREINHEQAKKCVEDFARHVVEMRAPAVLMIALNPVDQAGDGQPLPDMFVLDYNTSELEAIGLAETAKTIAMEVMQGRRQISNIEDDE